MYIAGAHSRIWKQLEDGSYQKYAKIQTLEPANWMWEVEHYGHATRKSTPLSPKNM